MMVQFQGSQARGISFYLGQDQPFVLVTPSTAGMQLTDIRESYQLDLIH